MKSAGCGAALLFVLLSGVQAFIPAGGGDNTHKTITEDALMDKILEVCKAVAESESRDFNPGSSLEELLRVCLGSATGRVSTAKFQEAQNQIYNQNVQVDRDFMASDPHHFNSERFTEGRALITQGNAAIKASIRKDSFQAARETLGRVLHTLQDFYSHSNWVELGNKEPYSPLIRPDLPIKNVADKATPTCSDCPGGTCSNQVLPSIIKQKKLTSGYMGIYSDEKPRGKCSHGGDTDLSSFQNPQGGISKDERKPHNAVHHDNAVKLATEASLELLEDIRRAVGNKDFLRLLGIARAAVLSFVIDTTGSMSHDIAEAKRVAYDIIDKKKGTQDEPSEYILVPFNDPSFGPLIRTTDPNVMKEAISKLRADGGGDLPEMCLSGLQLALAGAPSSSQIFVFTDAPAKDKHLENTIYALIRSTKSTVTYLLTPNTRLTRSVSSQVSPEFQLYYDLALASGGQAIKVTKAQLSSATEIIVDTSTSALVTILQKGNPGNAESFPFLIDASVSNVTVYITGDSLQFTLQSPSGVSQSNSVGKGSLADMQTVGNLWRVRLNSPAETGLWNIRVQSSQAYTIKVTGQSAITFIYDFVEEFKGPHPGYAAIYSRPQAGVPAKLLVTVTGQVGAAALKVSEVALVEVSGSRVAAGVIQPLQGGEYLVTVSAVPGGEFVVMIKGEETATASRFQRQSTTQMSLSNVVIKATVNSTLLPGENFTLPFSIMTNGTGGTYNVTIRNDRDIPLTYDKTVSLVSGVSTESAVTLSPPATTPSGTEVTLTIAAEGPGGADSNYVVLRLSVLAKVTDFTPPVCVIAGVSVSVCPSDCSNSTWELSVNITDGNGSGIESIFVQQGRGNFSRDTVEDGGVTVVQGIYSASCCSPNVTLYVVDKEGNVGDFSYAVQRSAGVSLHPSVSLWACLLLSALVSLQDVLKTPY